ncbi:hypothetical protein BGZ58_004927 [Dissophora ornata]|nr:hypothetical protein BGZ58_004927 [Dissophora ornata]
MDYHSLVITPTDEDGPLLGEDDIYDDDGEDGFATAVITEDYKETHESSDVGASSSTEHHLSFLGEPETKAENSNSEVATSAVFEEIMIVEGNADKVQEVVQETILSREIETTTTAAVVSEMDVEPTVTLLAVQEQPQSPQTQKQKKNKSSTKSGGSTPNAIRNSRPFAKLIRRSSSTSNVPQSTLPSSPTNSSPLGRLGGRLAKIIRQNDTQSKSGDSSPAMQEIKRTSIISHSISDVATTVIEEESSSVQKQDVQIDFHETVMSDDDDDEDETTLSTAVISEDPFAQYASPPFQPIFKRSSSSPSKRMSVVVDTTTQPVAIPRQSATSPSQRQSWAQSPTLHHGDGSAMTAGSGVKTGRASTVGSTVGAGSEAGSVGSSEVNILASSVGGGKDVSDGAGKPQKRRGSVLKKIGKIIKNNKEKSEEKEREKREKRLSRQGSTAMSSPVEAEENSGSF